MDFEIAPRSEAGGRLLPLAEAHAADFAKRAAEHDAASRFPVENFEALRASGVLMASLPERHRGLGVDSLHDLGLAVGRIARGDASTAIALNMHLAVLWNLGRRAMEGRAESAGADFLLRQIGRRGWILAGAATEPGTDSLHPLTEAVRTEAGWRIDGRKVFATGSPVADLFLVMLRIREDAGYAAGTAIVPRGTPGLSIDDDWDALGMRASGSGGLVADNLVLPDAAVVRTGRWGVPDAGFLRMAISGNAGLVHTSLGIAESAQAQAVDSVKSRRKTPDRGPLAERHAIQRLVAESEIDLAACRAMLSLHLQRADAFFGAHAPGEEAEDELRDLMKDSQCAKTFVNRKAIEIVDRALGAVGGSAYLTSSPLSRLYRDVRAGPFMQPYSPVEAFGYIGKVALGLQVRDDGVSSS